MTYEELVKTADDAVKLIDTDNITEHAAIEFDIEGEGEGAFYFELSEGKAVVEPYEYYDKDCRIRTTADVLKELISGSLDLDTAIATRRLRVEGNSEKIAFLAGIIKEAVANKAKKAVKKPVARRTAAKKATETAEVSDETKEVKATAKKAATKKTTTKKTAEAEATETKSAEKKAPAKKTVAKKASAKEESTADTPAEAKPKKATKKATTKKA